ncbi:MAG: malonic semialdehyde reductase [Micavibrio sp.]|nr:malonic semialdehyde reductase [Micavibrio sp.]|tara:strand:+ start:179 stop:781 length:603 start_codon:yes stop_codon:yes gene_type:complete
MTKTPTTPLNQTAFEQLFTDARTYNAWSDRTVLDEQLKNLYDYVKYGPTSANCCPARFIFVRSDEAKEKLKPALDGSNVEKTMSAPATVIIAMDNEFYEELPKLFPHADAKSWFDSDEEKAKDAAFRNSTLQGGYLIMAARALGLDCGPMSGFDKDKVKDAFFPDKNWTANFLCNLGYGTEENLFPRSPRLKFDEACEIV